MTLPASLRAQGRQPATIVRAADFSGISYLQLADVSQAVQGELHPYPVSKRIDLTFRKHEVQFFIGTEKAVVDGSPTLLEATLIENARGVWVPQSFFQSGPLKPEFHKYIDLGLPVVSKRIIPQPVPQVSTSVPTVALGKIQAKITPAAAKPETKPEAEETSEQPAPLSHTIRRIVIDPGHGGKDPGTIGVKGTEEKDVNLWMGLELADALRGKDFEVLLTRTDDTFIPLAQRAALANRYKADLFISIHCNASLSSKLSGFEVYILSEKASDRHAAAVARLENASLEFEGKAPSAPVQAVLRSLAKNANINRSSQLGSIMDREVGDRLSQTDAGLQQAAFYVLRGAEMPAVLLEVGFLSNKSEEKLLADPGYRKKMIQAIEASILEFDKKEALKKG